MTDTTLPKHHWTTDKREASLFRKAEVRPLIKALRTKDGSKYYRRVKPRLSRQISWRTDYVVVDVLVHRRDNWFGSTGEYLVMDKLNGNMTNSVQDIIEQGYDWAG